MAGGGKIRRWRWVLLAIPAGLGAVAFGGFLGWLLWQASGRPVSTETLALALVQPGPRARESAYLSDPDRGSPEPSRRPRRWAAGEAPRLVIVVDDIGQSLGPVRELLALDLPLTFAILPDLPHSREAARMILAAGRQYIIHLPMEPGDYPVHDPGPNPMLLSLDLAETRRRLEGYLLDLPRAQGASNHMGSAYTADEPRMTLVQTELARRGLLFLNSKTSNSPVPARIAAQGGHRYLERDIFLDNVIERQAITRELRHALATARRLGSAIAIGHPHRETVEALRALAAARGRVQVEMARLGDLLPE